MQSIYKIRGKLDRILIGLAIFFFSAGVIVTFFGVVFRFIDIFPSLTWTDEITRFFMITSVFLATGIGIRKGTQIAFTLFLEKAPHFLFRILTVIIGISMIVFLVIIGFYGFKVAILNKDQLSAILQISMFYPYMVIPIGAFFMTLESVIIIIEAILGTAKRPNELNEPLGG